MYIYTSSVISIYYHCEVELVIFFNLVSYNLGITGNALPEDIDFFLSSGANHVVTKPLSRAKLLDALHRLVSVAMAAEEDLED